MSSEPIQEQTAQELIIVIKDLQNEIIRAVYAYAGISGNFHKSYFGYWDGYDVPIGTRRGHE